MAFHHYVMTVQAQTPRGLAFHTQSGVAEITPGTTRAQVYKQVLKQFRDLLPSGAGPMGVLHWSLEPNELTEGTAPSEPTAPEVEENTGRPGQRRPVALKRPHMPAPDFTAVPPSRTS